MKIRTKIYILKSLKPDKSNQPRYMDSGFVAIYKELIRNQSTKDKLVEKSWTGNVENLNILYVIGAVIYLGLCIYCYFTHL